MKKLKIIPSIVLTTLLATGSVLAWVNLGTVNTSDPLTATLWNATITRINEIATKVTENSTPPVFSASLTTQQSPTTLSLLTAWTEDVDNKNAFNSGIYTVPKAGYYKIINGGLFNHGGVSTYYGYLILKINDVVATQSHSSFDAVAGGNALSGINKIYYLNQGDTIKLFGIVTNVAAFFYGGVYTNYTIEYVGE